MSGCCKYLQVFSGGAYIATILIIDSKTFVAKDFLSPSPPRQYDPPLGRPERRRKVEGGKRRAANWEQESGEGRSRGPINVQPHDGRGHTCGFVVLTPI